MIPPCDIPFVRAAILHGHVKVEIAMREWLQKYQPVYFSHKVCKLMPSGENVWVYGGSMLKSNYTCRKECLTTFYALSFVLLSLFPFPSPHLQRLFVGELKRQRQWWWQWDMPGFHGLWNYSVLCYWLC
jgi:hypothetical protein